MGIEKFFIRFIRRWIIYQMNLSCPRSNKYKRIIRRSNLFRIDIC